MEEKKKVETITIVEITPVGATVHIIISSDQPLTQEEEGAIIADVNQDLASFGLKKDETKS